MRKATREEIGFEKSGRGEGCLQTKIWERVDGDSQGFCLCPNGHLYVCKMANDIQISPCDRR